MQILVVSSLSVVVGAEFLLSRSFLPEEREALIASLILVFLLSSSGVVTYTAGGTPTMNLNNFGEDFNKFYTHDHEVLAARWLAENRETDLDVYADELAALRLIAFGNGMFDVENAILPSTITRNSYVYADWANLSGITFAYHEGKQISYLYPLRFLEQNKDLIYDNGGARVFR